ncbi:MAG: MOSC domain-containing protein [Planctomycetota bacterium]|nr:MAG: MOSC domain-containing protein [Planctomycetota bacterium]
MQAIGKVQSVWRFPLKSMGGEQVDEAFVSYSGLVGDRWFALIDSERPVNRPWLTARQCPSLLTYSARYSSGSLSTEIKHPEIDAKTVEIVTPDRVTFNLGDAELIERLHSDSGRDLRIRYSDRGMVDTCPVSLVSTQTINRLSKECELDLDPRRFRANLYIDWSESGKAFYEDELVGQKLMIGEEVILYISKRDFRCKILSLDPETAEENSPVLATVGKKHDGYAGVYAAVLREGIVRPNDPVTMA